MSRKTRKDAQPAAGATPTARPVPAGRKLVLGLMAVVLAAVFIASFAYRLENPSLQVQAKKEAESPMVMIRELMARAEREPDNAAVLAMLGESFLRIGMAPKAIGYLERARQVDPRNVSVLERLGIAYFEADRYPDALGVFENIAALEPGNALAHYNIGFVNRYVQGDEERAKAEFEKILAIPGADEEMVRMAKEELARPAPKPEELMRPSAGHQSAVPTERPMGGQGMPPAGMGMPPQGMPPGGMSMPPQGMPPGGMSMPPQGMQMPPSGMPPQQNMKMPPSGMPPKGMEMPPQGTLPPGMSMPPRDVPTPPAPGEGRVTQPPPGPGVPMPPQAAPAPQGPGEQTSLGK